MANKVKFGLKNVHYALATYNDSTGEYTYGTPKLIAGAVNLSLQGVGSESPFYADNLVYFKAFANQGYSGDLEMALVPDSFKIDCLGEHKTTEGIQAEYADAKAKEFALLFEFTGDSRDRRSCLYNCICSRPDVASSTKTDTIAPITETLTITASPRFGDELVKASIENTEATATIFDEWFEAVQVPTKITAAP